MPTPASSQKDAYSLLIEAIDLGEVRPGDRKFTDYAFPASGNGGIGINAVTNTGGKVGWDRSPMMQPFQLPGYNPW